jgi:metal-sulfur cluster biosynthetic enzyme
MAHAGESAAHSASLVTNGRQRQATADPVDPDLAEILRGVSDPELGLNIVDLGLVYAALWRPDGIRVVMTTTSPSCPMADMLVESVRNALARKFPDVTTIAVEIALSPLWSPERISDKGRLELGWSKRSTAKASAEPSWTSKLFASFRRH